MVNLSSKIIKKFNLIKTNKLNKKINLQLNIKV